MSALLLQVPEEVAPQLVLLRENHGERDSRVFESEGDGRAIGSHHATAHVHFTAVVESYDATDLGT